MSKIKFDVATDNESLEVVDGKVQAKTTPLVTNDNGTVDTPASPNSIATAGDVANAINNAGFKVKTTNGDGSADELVKMGGTIEFDEGKNIDVVQKGNNFVVKTKDEVEFDKVTTDELKAGPVTINNEGIDAGNTKLKNVAKGTDDTDGVNFGQIKDISQSVANGLGGDTTVNPDGTISTKLNLGDGDSFNNVNDALKHLNKPRVYQGDLADSSDPDGLIKRKAGEKLVIRGGIDKLEDLASDPNIGVETFSDDTMRIKLAKNVRLGKDGSIDFEGTELDADGLEIKDGPKFTRTDIDASGQQIHGVKAGEKPEDAVNLSQLKEMTAKARTEVRAGDHIKDVVKTEGVNGEDIYTVNAKDIVKGSDALTIDEEKENFTVDLSQGTKDTLDKAKKGFFITADTVESGADQQADKKDRVELAQTVKFTSDDDNIRTMVDDNEISFGLANKVVIGDNQASNPISIDSNLGDITGLSNKTLDSDDFATKGRAATEEQVKAGVEKAQKYADSKTFGVKDSKGNELVKKVDNTIDIIGADNNISTVVKDDKLQIKLSDKLTGIKKISDLEDNLNTYVEEGIKPTNLNEIGKNVANINDVLNAGWNVKNNGEAKDFVTPYDTVDFVDGKGTTAVVTSENGISKVKFDINTGEVNADASTGGPATGTDGFVTGKQVADAVNKTGFNLTAQGENSSVVNPSETVDMKNTDGNIVISKTADSNDVNYDLAKDISVDNVTAKKGLTIGEGDNAINFKPEQTTALDNAGTQKTDIPAVNLGGSTLTGVANNIVDNDKAGKLADNVNKSNVATVSDTLNTGWNLQVNDEAKDFVKSYDTINFKGENGITVKHDTAGDKNNLTIALEKGDVGATGQGGAGGNEGFVTGEQVADAINKSFWTVTGVGDEQHLEGGEAKNIHPSEKVDFEAGKNMKLVQNGTKFTYETQDDVEFNNVKVGDVVINQETGINAGNKKITGVADGEISATSSDAVNGRQLHVFETAFNEQVETIKSLPLIFAGDTGETEQKLGEKLDIVSGTAKQGFSGTNVATKVEKGKAIIGISDNPTFDTVQIGGAKGPKMVATKNGSIAMTKADGKTLTPIQAAPGKGPNDVATVRQVDSVVTGLNEKIKQTSDQAKAGSSVAIATAHLPQPYSPGASMLSASLGYFEGAESVAVGLSTISDNGKWVLKGSLSSDTKDTNLGAGVGVGYQW
ncbi:MAG: YadA-like family protein [Gammaproteobacteria bacterium]|nr:YadA-like family protein [Gammaproteobacteria bacterium]